MNRILILLSISVITLGTINAQDTAGDISSLTDILTDDQAAKDFNFGQYIDTTTTTSEDLTAILVDEGYSEEEIAAVSPTLDGIANGDITSLGQISEDQYDLLIDVIGSKAADEFFKGSEGDELRSQIKTLSNALKTLSGFGQANAQAARASSLYGYQGYDHFAFSFGMITSIASDDPNNVYDIASDGGSEELERQLEEGGLSAGIAIQGFAANVGINMDWLVEKLYLGAIIGYTGVSLDSEELVVSPLWIPVTVADAPSASSDIGLEANMTSLTIGVTGNYQLIKPLKIPFLFRWNGLSLGTGIIYNSFNISADADLSGLFPSADGTEIEANSFLATFDISSSSLTIPLDASTGIRLLSAVNLSLGAGIDLQFGGSNVSFNLEGSDSDNLSTKLMASVLDKVLEEGDLAFPYDKDHSINFFNPRVNAGIGIGLGPVTALDISATYYFRSGVTFGANFIFRL